MAISGEKLYEEIGRAWLHYVSWRERIFAGYLSVLAVLAFAFSKEQDPLVRSAVFACGILVSGVFRILDFRTTELVNLCQVAADELAGSKGFYGHLNRRRFGVMDGRSRRLYLRLWISGTSYGLAINILVASISAASLVGCCVELQRYMSGGSLYKPIVAVVLAFVIFALLQWYA